MKVRSPETGRFVKGTRDPEARYTTNPIYCTWKELVSRCTNPKRADWEYFGGAGITLYEPWMSYERFRHDILSLLGPRPLKHVLGRLDLKKGYEPSNVQWASQGEQTRKRRGVKLNVEIVSAIRGASKTLSQKKIAAQFGIGQSQVSRILSGQRWADKASERVITTKARKRKRRKNLCLTTSQ